jgi:hypothetical protein
VLAGDGRILTCREKRQKDVSERYKQAFKDVELK